MPIIKFQDEYNIRYEVEYAYKPTPTGEILDIVTTVYDPRVYGESSRGYVLNHKTFIKGLVSITRQVIRPEEDGYTLIGEGGSQTVTSRPEEYIQIDGLFYSSVFKFNLDHAIVAEESGIVDDGSALVNIYDTLNSCIWASVDGSGNIIPAAGNVLAFIDVW